jgi:predicted nucleic-acid-binding Zn-ribbon protein
MRNSICPRCNSTDIHSNIELNGIMSVTTHRMTVDANTSVQLEVCVCGRCGYLEQYIAYANELAQVTNRWPKNNSGTEEQ